MRPWLIAAACSAALLTIVTWLIFALIGWYWPETRWYSLGSLWFFAFAAGTVFFYNKIDDK